MKESELALDLGDVTLRCSSDEVAVTFAALLREMRLMMPRLRPDERLALREIMAHENLTLTVGKLFPGFKRESENHKTLRRLRAAQLIRPARTGRWDPEEPIEVKPFARVAWERLGEEQLCTRTLNSTVPAVPEDSEEVVLDEPVTSAEREDEAAVILDDQDVLDLLEYSEAELRGRA